MAGRHRRPRWWHRTRRVAPHPDVAPLRALEVPPMPDTPPPTAADTQPIHLPQQRSAV